ncbi:MAG TPA: hypothetical protein PKC43_12610 [Phycisphaerales bacterium]|nr:hypothetical protein [Phycisphaerales bacterium]HMP38274.1 hypothetical protein [Phycisphaerales bacterium]
MPRTSSSRSWSMRVRRRIDIVAAAAVLVVVPPLTLTASGKPAVAPRAAFWVGFGPVQPPPNPYDRLVESRSPQPARGESMRDYVERWRRLGPILAEFEAEELRVNDQSAASRVVDDGIAILLRIDPPGPSSGMVEMQRWFARWTTMTPPAERPGAACWRWSRNR